MKRTIGLLAILLTGLTASAQKVARSDGPDLDTLPEVGTEGGPRRTLDDFDTERWLAGRRLFARSFEQEDGLGSPGFNSDSCASCHEDPVLGGAGGLQKNVGAPTGGGSRYLGPTALPQEADKNERFTHAVLRASLFEEAAETRNPAKRMQLVAGTVQTPSVLGLGRIDTVFEDEILGREDPDDANGDGVRGVASRVRVGDTTVIGRFGWKAELPTLRDFVRSACGGELGLTVNDEGTGFGLLTDGDAVPDPEMTLGQIGDLIFYCEELAAPARGGRRNEPDVQRGARVFDGVGCSSCHVPSLQGYDGPVELYSDLLLHGVVKDRVVVSSKSAGMRIRFEDGRHARAGTPRMVDELVMTRTAPLWGISKTAPYLHDGRARTLEDAIVAHEGEAETVRAAFQRLDEKDRSALLAFLEDL